MLGEQMLGSWLWEDTLLPLSCFDFADRVFFNFRRSLPSGGECLIELNH